MRSPAREFWTSTQVLAPPMNMIAPMTAMTMPVILTKLPVFLVSAVPAVGWVVVVLMVRSCLGCGAGPPAPPILLRRVVVEQTTTVSAASQVPPPGAGSLARSGAHDAGAGPHVVEAPAVARGEHG